MVDGEMVVYDGVSGSHTTFFMALDAFLGMDQYLSQENASRCIPHNQRALCASLRKHSFISRLQAEGDEDIVEASQKIVNHLKVRHNLQQFPKKLLGLIFNCRYGGRLTKQGLCRISHSKLRRGP